MSKKIFLIFICLALISVTSFAQVVKQYSLADDASYYFFDSRVVSAPTNGHAVVFFSYVGNADLVTRIGKQYIKSVVVGKKGKPGKPNILAEAEWYYDGGAPANARNNYDAPRIIDVIWNHDQKGFDLYLTTQTPWEPGKPQKTILWLMPLNIRGEQTGKMRRVGRYDENGGYYDFYESRKFVYGPDGRRILMTTNQKTYNVRLTLFNKRGKVLAIKENILDNNVNSVTRHPLALVNFDNRSICLYSQYLDPKTNLLTLDVEVYDASTLEKLSGAKNFSIQAETYNAAFGGGSHLFYNSQYMSGANRYEVQFLTVGVKNKPISPMRVLTHGRVLATQHIGASLHGSAEFNMFTIEERHHPHLDSIYMTKIGARGKLFGNTKKIFEVDLSSLSLLVNPYAITETPNGNILLVDKHILWVRTPR